MPSFKEGNLRLDESEKKELVLWYRTGKYSQKGLANIFGVSRTVVYDALKRYKFYSVERLLGG